MKRHCVIAYSGEVGINWVESLSGLGFSYTIYDTGHRTGRNHSQVHHQPRSHDWQNRQHDSESSPDRVLEDVIALADNYLTTRRTLIDIRNIITKVLETDKLDDREAPKSLSAVTEEPKLEGLNVVRIENNPKMNESNVWLSYIINNYETLPDYIAFVQGYPFDHCEKKLFYKLLTSFKGGFSCLPEAKLGKGHSGFEREIEAILSSIGKSMGDFCWSPGAQFITDKESILKHPKFYYENLYNDTKDINNIGHGFERTWYNIIH